MSPSLITTLEVIFWTSTALVVYTFFLYPVLLLLLASGHQVWRDLRFAVNRRNRRSRQKDAEPPRVSVVFAAYNEAAVIAEKMKNCADLDYPEGYLEIVVGCDGCSDQTAEIARMQRLSNARILEFDQRRGKPATLNDLVAEAKGEIIVFSDANTILDPGAIRSLVRHFSDSRTGCVCGEIRFFSRDGNTPTEGVYWRYEVFLKFLESRLNALLGANGALFAIRKRLFSALPPEGIVDDFLIAMQIRAKGHQVVYDPEAICREETAQSVGHEFKRRVRIAAGNFHALRFTWRLLSPTAGLIAFSYWSHKVSRWIVPFALVFAGVSAAALSANPFYVASLCLGIIVAALALVGRYLELRNIYRAIFSVPYYFFSMNLALLLGFLRFLNGQQTSVWDRTARGQQS